ncbi:MAG: hypothetical protein RR585_03210 [Coprobacillus sp.]
MEKDIEVIKVESVEKEFVSRQSVYMLIKDQPVDEVIAKHNTPFTIDGPNVYYRNKHNDNITFNLLTIKEIHLDLKARFVNFGIFSQFTFFTLIDFISDKGTYMFAAKNQDDFIKIIHHFHSLDIPISDPREIEAAYKKYPRELERCKFFQRTHKDLIKYGAYNQESVFDRFKTNAMNKKR